jgi:hypothetical protein
MKNLLDLWKDNIPNYGENFKKLFESLAKKGSLGGDQKALGRHFDTNYEFYIFAFFYGLYNNEFIELANVKKVNFGQAIKFWGNKSSPIRKDFSHLQNFIFAALIAKTEFDFLALERGDLDPSDVIKKLMVTLEGFTNGGLTLIEEKMSESPNFFLLSPAFLDMIVEIKSQSLLR